MERTGSHLTVSVGRAIEKTVQSWKYTVVRRRQLDILEDVLEWISEELFP